MRGSLHPTPPSGPADGQRHPPRVGGQGYWASQQPLWVPPAPPPPRKSHHTYAACATPTRPSHPSSPTSGPASVQGPGAELTRPPDPTQLWPGPNEAQSSGGPPPSHPYAPCLPTFLPAVPSSHRGQPPLRPTGNSPTGSQDLGPEVSPWAGPHQPGQDTLSPTKPPRQSLGHPQGSQPRVPGPPLPRISRPRSPGSPGRRGMWLPLGCSEGGGQSAEPNLMHVKMPHSWRQNLASGFLIVCFILNFSPIIGSRSSNQNLYTNVHCSSVHSRRPP